MTPAAVPPPVASLSRAQARRVALVAQGFRDPRHTVPTMRTFNRALARTGVLQIDSVNVFQRAHYMPLFSRMGHYDTELLRRAAERRPRRIVEYWAHVAAFMPVDLWPQMGHRMAQYRERGHAWMGLPERRELVASLVAEIRERGPSTSRDLDDGLPRRREHWGWNWSETKKALEYLFLAGELAVAGRTQQFERLYDLPERVVPHEYLDAPVPAKAEAAVELVRRAAVSHGVGTEQCFRDYYRLGSPAARPAVAALVESGELLPVRVEGWDRPAYLHRDARLPRRVDARALLSPFDPVVWERARTEALFGFRYRIEIYVPEPQRVHGYYVLPFLLGDSLVARVDLKADRQGGLLLVKGAHAEPGAPAETAAELAAELADAAAWLGLDSIDVEPRGDLAGELLHEVKALTGG
ncbi:MAG TPA: crosslink repair DNA glycosylase YcaQ family protein [Nocardioidaceae bacterium]|nr:crosslink repair DNA glycosylase YcaQ family protein [Nocardioidaceae bacterium]